MDIASKEVSVPKADTSRFAAETKAEAIRITISDPKAEEDKVRQLYDALVRIKSKESEQAPISYQQFSRYIATQTQGIQKRHGCTRVAFTIALDEDSIRFTATAENR